MSTGVTIKNLKPIELTEMYLAFLDSFSDYPVPFKLSKEQFVRKFVEKLRIDFSLSVGAFDYDVLAGFIFTSVGHYEGKLTAYNGGTGVRPAYRGRKITIQMFNHLLPLFKKKKIKQCILEVLIQNEAAIKTYETIGFERNKHFKCFRLNKSNFKRQTAIDLEIFRVKRPNWDTYNTFADQAASFLDSPQMINENLANETIIEVHNNEKCIGYAIYQPALGRISQIGVDPVYRKRGIGSSIIKYILDQSNYKTLTVINIKEESVATLNFFQHLGFNNQLDQYEMILPLQ